MPVDLNVTRSSLAFVVSLLISGSVSSSLLLMILCTSYGVFFLAFLAELSI